MRNTIIFGGPCRSGKRHLIRRIVGGNLVDERDLLNVVRCCTWYVDNKYYTANLDIWLVNNDSIAWKPIQDDASSDSNLVQIDDLVKEAPQGLILAFDLNNEQSFLELAVWETFIDEHYPEVLVVIGNETKPNTAKSTLQAKAEAWALKHGLEFIRVSWEGEQPAPIPQQRQPLGSRTDELGGVSRVIEAFHANMWKALSLKPKPTRLTPIDTLNGSKGKVKRNGKKKPKRVVKRMVVKKVKKKKKKTTKCKATQVTTAPTNANTPSMQPLLSVSPPTPEAVTSTITEGAAAATVENTCRQPKSTTDSETTRTREETTAPIANSAAQTTAVDDKGEGEQQDMDAGEFMETFERMMDKIKDVRANANSLPDAERRRRAEQLVMELAASEAWD